MERQSLEGIEEKIKEILVKQLEIQPEVIAAVELETPLLGRGVGLDSIETLTLVTGIEEVFGIQVDDDELTTDLFATVGSLAAYVMKKVLHS